jgi:Escherichia/Staphylococcus phage prohead protease
VTDRLEYRDRPLQLRTAGRTLFGLAAPYNEAAQIGGFTERIKPGAFRTSLRSGGDIRLLMDHNMGALLARSGNNSLVLEDQADGLHFRAELAEFSAADDALAMARTGLLSGASIGFLLRRDEWSSDRAERVLLDVELVEISVITGGEPVYSTSVAARSRQPGRRLDPGALSARYWRP